MFPISDLNPTRVTPLFTLAIIAANVGVFFLWQPRGGVEEVEFLYAHAAVACELTTGEPLTVDEIVRGFCQTDASRVALFPQKTVALSVPVSMFLHGGLLHLAGNMWFLWVFGNNVEEAFGRLGYAVLYLAAGVVGTVGFVLGNPESTTPLVGASGAIAGVLGAYFVLFPGQSVLALAFIYVIPVPALIFLGLWFAGQFAVAQPGVAWEAHAAGFLAGIALTLPFRSMLLGRVRELHRSR